MVPKSRFQDGAHEFAARFVRHGIRQGRWAAGDALDVTALAKELNISASPIREALARLRGERVLSTHHRNGFSIPLLQPHELVAEYRLLGVIAGALARQRIVETPGRVTDQPSYADRLAAFLMALATAADLPAAAPILQGTCLRMHSYISLEPLHVAFAAQRLAQMESLVATNPARDLPNLVRQQFEACIEAAPQICRHVFERSKRSGKGFE